MSPFSFRLAARSATLLLVLAVLLSLFPPALSAQDAPPVIPPDASLNPYPPPQLPDEAYAQGVDASEELAPLQLAAPAAAPSAGADVTPARISITRKPGEKHEETMKVFTGDAPIGKGDVMFVFDRTGSMGDEIWEAKNSAVKIMTEIRNQLPSAWFGVASFMDYTRCYDYPGYYGCYGDSSTDFPWSLDLRPTDSIADVSKKINTLKLGYGGDWPEDYTRVLYELRFPAIGWRPNTKKMVVLFGDAPTHDLNFAKYNFGGDPGRDNRAMTGDDLDFEKTVAELDAAKVSVVAVNSGTDYESKATFKGMSIGFDAVKGTHGLYYPLSKASEIPAAVVSLIKEQTQKIGQLTFEVTDGYENWIVINPGSKENVPANTTEEFKVTVTVPQGTAPGFYPFYVKILGDDAILDLMYVDVTVPTDSPKSDIGFRPDPDGYGFANLSSAQTWDMFRQFFGKNAVEYPDGQRIHVAETFFEGAYKASGSGGSCDGISGTSLLNYDGLWQPSAGQYEMPHHSNLFMVKSGSTFQKNYAYSQGIQQSLEVLKHKAYLCEALGQRPSKFFQLLKAQIETGRGAVLWWGADKDYKLLGQTIVPMGAWHAVVAYRYETRGSDGADVYVYDSNYPGNDDMKMSFDLKNDRWSYQMPLPLWQSITLEGSAAQCLLSVIPIDIYQRPGIPRWDVPVTAATESDGQIFEAENVRLLFTDDLGRRFGWDGARFYGEIGGAAYHPATSNDGASGSYLLPTGAISTIKLTARSGVPASVLSWRNAALLQVRNIQVAQPTTLRLNMDREGNFVSVGDADGQLQVDLSITRQLSSEDRTATVRRLTLGAGEQAQLDYRPGAGTGPDTIKLQSNGRSNSDYELSLRRGGVPGYVVFGAGRRSLDPNTAHTIKVQQWDGLSTVTVEVDAGRNGSVDTRETVTNESAAQTISVTPGALRVRTGSADVPVTVGVRDQFGAYVKDGTNVMLTSTLGTTVAARATTRGGLAEFRFTPGAQRGIATLIATADGIAGAALITVEGTTYLPTMQR